MIEKFALGARKWSGIARFIEEAGDAIQVCGKLIATDGDVGHWDGTDLKEKLEDKLANLLAAINFLIYTNGLDGKRIGNRSDKKGSQFRDWHRAELIKNKLANKGV